MFKVDAILGSVSLSLKEISRFEKGSIIDLKIPAGDKVKCYHNDEFLFNAEVMVFEKNLAVRISNYIKSVEFDMPYIDIKPIEYKEIETPFDFLSSLTNIKDDYLSNFLCLEHPQTVALILSHLKSNHAARLLSLFDDDLRAEVIMRIAQLKEVSPSVISQISLILESRLESLSGYKIELGGPSSVSEIFKYFEDDISSSVISHIEEVNQDLAEIISSDLVTFEDILSFPQLKKVLQNLDDKIIFLALKGTSSRLFNEIKSLLSEKKKQKVLDIESTIGEYTVKDISSAQKEIIELLRTSKKV